MVEELIRGIDHVGVTVPDMEKATDFFKKVFGAKVAYDNQKPVIASDLGVQHFAIYVNDIDEVSKRFVNAGGELLTEPDDFLGSIESGSGRFVYGRTP